MADITDNENTEMPKLAESLTTQYTDVDFHSAFASVGTPSTRLSSIATECCSECLL